jgi:hypothetical protein
MEAEFIPYEQALALKELGFDKPCFRGWDKNNKIWYHPDSDIILDNPTFSQAFRWFRYKKIRSIVQEYDFNNYIFSIDDGINRDIEVIGYDTYEEAELECLKKLIEIIKEKTL